MRTTHKAITILYATLLLAGAVFALSGVVVGALRYSSAAAGYGPNWFQFGGWYVVGHAGTGIALLLLTAAFAIVHFLWGHRVFAPVVYLLSYGACGLALLIVLESSGKGETSGEDLRTFILGALILLIPVMLVSAAGLAWSTQKKPSPQIFDN